METGGRRQELGRFLRDRRGRVAPRDVGLPEGAHRRVAGLRREEVATLAGVGVSWYTMLENGTAAGVSAATLDAIARALRLTPDEIAYLHRLAEERVAGVPLAEMRPVTRAALDAIEWAPAYVCTSQWTVLAWNRAMSLVWGIEPPGGVPFNIVTRTFADPAFRAMHGDRFAEFARRLVAMVRASTASRFEDVAYRGQIERWREDAVFAEAWDAYALTHPTGPIATIVDSVIVGTFSYRTLTLEVPEDDGHWIVMQVPDAPSAVRLREALAFPVHESLERGRSHAVDA